MEAKLVAAEMGIDADFPRISKRKGKILDYCDIVRRRHQIETEGIPLDHSDEDHFRINVFLCASGISNIWSINKVQSGERNR